MYLVIYEIDDRTYREDCASWRDAEAFAGDLEEDGYTCTIAEVVRTVRPEQPKESS